MSFLATQNSIAIGLGGIVSLRNAYGGSGLPGTYYDFTGATLPAPFSSITRTGTATYVDSAGVISRCDIVLPDYRSSWAAGGAGASVSSVTFSPTTGVGSVSRVTASDQGAVTFTSTSFSASVRVVIRCTAGTVVVKSGNYAATVVATLVAGDSQTVYTTTDTLGRTSIACPLTNPSSGSFVVESIQLVSGYGIRQTHNPATLAPLGLLVEGQAVNRQSSNFANWVIQAAGWTRNPGATTGLDGAPADTFTESTVTDSRSIYRDPRSPASGPSTFTIAFRKISGADRWMRIVIGSAAGDFATVTFNMQTGAVAEAAQTFGTASAASASAAVTPSGWIVATLTATLAAAIVFDFLIPLDAPTPGHNSGDWDRMGYLGTGAVIALDRPQDEAGMVATSYIPNPGTGTVVRTGDFAGGGLTGSALTTLFPEGFARNTIVFEFRKGYVGGFEALFALSAGSSYDTGNGLLLRSNNDPFASFGGNSSSVTDTGIVTDGVTLNKIALSWDTSTTTAAMSVNGRTPVVVETLDFTGVGTTHLILGALTTGGLQSAARFTTPGIRVIAGSYKTGAELQALSV